jgi:hypothetical protein
MDNSVCSLRPSVVTQAPYFTTYVSQSVFYAYDAWAHHYNECLSCAPYDWYNPDPKDLCEEGRKLYLTWNRSVMLESFPTSARKLLADAS